MYWIVSLINVNSQVAVEVLENKEGRRVVQKFCMSADSSEVYLAYTVLGSLTYISSDLSFVSQLLKLDVIKFQIHSVDYNAFNRISWTLCNILADDISSEGLFEDLVKTKGFMDVLLQALNTHARSAKDVSYDLVTSLLALGNKQFILSLLDDYKVMSLVEAYLERIDSARHLFAGLRVLQALFEKSKYEFASRRVEDDPVVNRLLHNPYLLDLLERLNKCPFRSVFDLWNELCTEYLPMSN